VRHRLLTATAATAVLLAACGGGEPAAEDIDGMDGMSGMVMDEPDATRADELGDVEQLRSSPVALFEDAPERFEDVTGQAWAAFGDDPGTTVTLDLSGLPPDEEVIAHLHAEPCAVRGGPHFQFEEDGPEVPPNEVHLAGTPGDDGTLSLTVTNGDTASGAQSLVFHPRADTDTYVGCVDLREETTTVG